MSLRTRIALLVGVTVLLASTIGGLGTVVSSQTVGRDRVDQALLGDADTFDARNPRVAAQLQFSFDARRAACNEEGAGDITEGGTDETGSGNDRPAVRQGGRLRFLPEFASVMQVLRSDGVVIAACEMLPSDAADQAIAVEGTGTRFQSVTIEGERFRLITRGYGELGAVQFGRSLEITNDTLRDLLVRSLGFGLLGALLASALGWFFASRATEPVRHLNETAERVARTQDLGERIEIASTDEIGALAESFNTMLSSLDTSREQQNRLVQDASHELRTPLTSIRTNVELLQRHTDIDSDTRSQVLADISAELHELTQLTGELVDSATHVPTVIERNDEIDLIGLVKDCADRAHRRHRRVVAVSVIDTASNVATPSQIIGDASLLDRAVTNLLNNAVKFSDGDIEVEVQASSVLVQDRGPGIADADLDYIFDRFYRATVARSAPGSGLGLAIVKQIVDGHGGSVHAANRAGGGAEIGFSLLQEPAHRA